MDGRVHESRNGDGHLLSPDAGDGRIHSFLYGHRRKSTTFHIYVVSFLDDYFLYFAVHSIQDAGEGGENILNKRLGGVEKSYILAYVSTVDGLK